MVALTYLSIIKHLRAMDLLTLYSLLYLYAIASLWLCAVAKIEISIELPRHRPLWWWRA